MPNGKAVVFGIPMTFLSVLQQDRDFDTESNEILEKVKDTDHDMVFEYHEQGFFEVDIKDQQWFSFNR